MNGKNSDFISIAELSKLVNKSPQWIYKMIKEKPSFSKYAKTIDGKKRVHKSAIWQVFGIDYDGCETDYKPVDENTDPVITALNAQITMLNEQLKTKDQQIERFQVLLANSQQQLQQVTALIANQDKSEQKQKQENEQQKEEEYINPYKQQTETAKTDKNEIEQKEQAQKKTFFDRFINWLLGI